MPVRALFAFYLAALTLFAQSRSDFAAGMRAYKEGNFTQALAILADEAQRGNPVAAYTVGNIYASGRGVGVNQTEALRWYRMAGEKGHADSQYTLGYMLERGQGTAKGETEATLPMFREARQQPENDDRFIVEPMELAN